MLSFMAVLWSFWTYPQSEDETSISLWWQFIGRAISSPVSEYLTLLGIVAAGVVVSVMAHYVVHRPWLKRYWIVAGFNGHLVITSLMLMPLVLFSIPDVQQFLMRHTRLEVQAMVSAELNELEKARLLQGYYDDLVRQTDPTSPMRQMETVTEEWESLLAAGGLNVSNDMLQRYLKPSVSVAYKGGILSTNQWGMRDREYSLDKPDSTYRFALLGGSDVMGSGVNDDEVAESIVEARLNDYAAAHGRAGRVEILNFSVIGYHLMQKVKLMDDRVPGFQPDALLYISPQREEFRIANKIPKMLQRGQDLEYPFLVKLCDSLGLSAASTTSDIKRAVSPHTDRIIRWGYQAIADSCRKQGIVPIWVYMPTLDHEDANERDEFRKLKTLTEGLGFIVLDLSGLYAGHDYADLQLNAIDRHPNAKAHSLIADRLYRELLQLAPSIGLWPTGTD
jgi:hypothetical protein